MLGGIIHKFVVFISPNNGCGFNRDSTRTNDLPAGVAKCFKRGGIGHCLHYLFTVVKVKDTFNWGGEWGFDADALPRFCSIFNSSSILL
jgi:hypothetical protein